MKTIEDKIRAAMATKIRVTITGVKRCKAGFIVISHDGTIVRLPTRKIALAFALAIARCAPIRSITVKPVRIVRKQIKVEKRPIGIDEAFHSLLKNSQNPK